MSVSQVLVSSSVEEWAGPYVEALKVVGVPADRIRVLAPGEETADPAALRALAASAAGLVLSGGADVDPSRYGEAALPGVEALPARDAMEWELLAGAREAGRPVWGVCRGLQVLNVFLGGTLWQDLPSQLPGIGEHEVPRPVDALAHGVRVTAPESGLGGKLAREVLLANSRHHQAARRLGEGLAVVATSPDGLVEALELEEGAEGWWVRAVQWHPENLVALAQHRDLWRDFVAAAGVHPAPAGERRS